MPSIENWTSQPLRTIQNLFENRKDDKEWIKDVEKYFTERLCKFSNLKMISSLNDLPLHELQCGNLVRFRCMIQDTFEPEYFLETYEITKQNGGKVLCTSVFKDIIDYPEDFEIMESQNNKTGCRQVLYCVAIPGETKWVKEKYNNRSMSQTSSTSGVSKRSLEDDEMEDESKPNGHGNNAAMMNGHETNKRQRSTESGDASRRTPLTKNHPLPDEDGPVCIVKVYDEDKDFKVNEVYEFVGVLSVDPSLSATFDSHMEGQVMNGIESDSDHMEEQKAHHPPPSFVPRLHCVSMQKLSHNNPLLHQSDKIESELSMSSLRNDLISFLTQATFGDELVAEYLLMHLVARVYTRTGAMAVGKFSLNISNIPPGTKYPNLLSQLLQQLLTKVHFLPMTLDNMNSMKFVPTKNYSTNRLDSGILQLSDGTHFIVDETSLRPGQLDTNGVKHVQALAALLNFQKVDYNFQFHPVIFNHDIPMLILSEGKSMLPCDSQVPLSPESSIPSDLEAHFNSMCIPHDMMEKFRAYLSIARLSDYELDQNMMKTIENDFVAARQQSNDNMSADDLHLHLVVARLLSVTSGQKQLSLDLWQRVGMLEQRRKERLQRR